MKTKQIAVFAAMLSICLWFLILPVHAQKIPEIPISSPGDVSGLTSSQQSIGHTVINTCWFLGTPTTDAMTDFSQRCLDIVGAAQSSENDAALSEVLSEIDSTETNTMGRTTVEVSSVQAGYVAGRMAALRDKSSGGLAMNFNGVSLEPVYFAGPVTSLPASDDTVSGIGGRLGFFISGHYSTGEKDATDLEPGFDFDGWALTAGTDYRLTESLVMGIAAGYSTSDADIDSSGGELDLSGYGVSMYGTYFSNNFYVDMIATYGVKDFDLMRRVGYQITVYDGTLQPTDAVSTINQEFMSETDSDEINLSVGTGYDFHFSGLSVTPYLRLNYLDASIDGYTETPSGNNTNAGYGMAVQLDDQELDSLTTALGGQVTYAISTSAGVISPYVNIEWEHEFKNDARRITGQFVNDPNDNTFVIFTDEPDANYFNLGFGVSMVCPGGIMGFADYRTVLGLEDITAHQVSAGIRFEI